MMSKPPLYSAQWPIYAKQWDVMHITPNRAREVGQVAERLVEHKDRYVAVEKDTLVPWYMIAVIHEREGSGNFDLSLAQGDPWRRRSTHVPKGRGPFQSWEAAAVDAIEIDHLTHADVKDWRLEKILYHLEGYNGWGYHDFHGIPSPYLWGATSIQGRGKYTSDGHWDAHEWDMQLGCCAMLLNMKMLDPSIQFIRET